ncbi:MAG: hypothetical protein H8E80_04535 [Desulfobacteraceae bacterium]|uniref:Chromosomal replication initiator DnaA C-terminal domain-containing protein n=1 Tax=Candidatus Desulfaltia bathyphila TaxID=2841697 RepID=A0A8J6N6A7_9BACT|nr:hypothetical protein [Candidatus Desulfaltia bathyphila]
MKALDKYPWTGHSAILGWRKNPLIPKLENELIKRVSKDRNIDIKDLISFKRKKDISNTRAIISYLAAIELRHSGAKIASELRLSEKSVSRCIERGKKIALVPLNPVLHLFNWYDNDKELLEYLQ